MFTSPVYPKIVQVLAAAVVGTAVVCAGGCAAEVDRTSADRCIGAEAYQRQGDEIMIAGHLFHTGAPVVLWTDPGGYDAYRVERRFGPLDRASWEATEKDPRNKPETPNRYGARFIRFADPKPTSGAAAGAAGQEVGATGNTTVAGSARSTAARSTPLSDDTIARVRGGGWTLADVQQVVDQFVLHYDVCGTSKTCFRVLQDQRGLSVHFMLDLDGTIYQTLDVKERAWHATISNDRSVGIEIANIGAYGPDESSPLASWYTHNAQGRTVITIPPDHLDANGDSGVRTHGFIGSPARPDPIIGEVQGRPLTMYDLTPQQYDSLTKLTAALCTALPQIRCDYPRNEQGQLITHTLSPTQLKNYSGVLGHFHVQENKVDPGPALQWDTVIDGARAIMRHNAPPASDPSGG